MVKRHCYVFLSCLFLLPWSCFGQSRDWLDISPADLAIKQVPGDPGAPAILLYYADYHDDNSATQFFYHRIKILTDAGRIYANVEIPIAPLFHFVDLKARTIHPDGSIVEFTGKPFEKTIIKTADTKFVAETFTMPDVTVGSIIEYKYRYEWGRYAIDREWSVQHDLFTLKERFSMKGYSGGLVTKNSRYGEDTRLSYVVYGDVTPPTKGKGGAIELELENVPAFKAEEYAPPEGNLKPIVRFFYGGSEVKSPEAFWRDYGRDWYNQAEHFIGNRDPIRNAAAQAVAGESDPEKKLRKLYALAQKTRNLTFERERSQQEEKKEELKPNENAADVLERGYGTYNEIARLFVALARAAGFEAQLVRAPNRESYFFKLKYLSRQQLSSEIAVIKLNGNELYLDPGTAFCPFGLVRWIHTDDQGLRLEKNGGTFVAIPPAVADRTPIRRIARVNLSPDGSLKGTVEVELRGNAALEHRLEAINQDEAGRRKDLEDEAKAWLPPNSIVTLERVEGWEATEEPLHVNYKVEVPAFAQTVGKRLLVPAGLFRISRQRKAFEHSERKYAVYFPFAYQELDNVILQTPDGYSPESVPPATDVKLTSTRFITSRTVAGNQFVSKRALVVNGIMFPVTLYPELKGFFGKVLAADQELLVLQSSVATAGK
jgi:uncharacterized protein DUF3857/transglutaminase superfamily protein